VSGPLPLRDSAVSAVRRWQFAPYKLAAHHAPLGEVVYVNFSLD
jgi:hypothetical protein